MSADNWTTCPRCADAREDQLRALDIDIANAYGSVSVEEFDRMRRERDDLAAAAPEPTFREDYEFWGAADGVIHVSYSGECTRCHLAHSIEDDQQFYERTTSTPERTS